MLLYDSHPSSYTVFGEFVLSYSNFQVILAKNTFENKVFVKYQAIT